MSLSTGAGFAKIWYRTDMRRFERVDANPVEQQRLEEYTDTLYRVLVPGSGDSASVQDELIRARSRLESDYYREGMGNYYEHDASENLAETYYGGLVVFMLDTLIENRNQALDDQDVAYFVEVRRTVEPNWQWKKRLDALNNRAEGTDQPELSAIEEQELEQLESGGPTLDWEELFERAQRCIANWCIMNPTLIDRGGRAVDHGAVREVTQIVTTGLREDHFHHDHRLPGDHGREVARTGCATG